MGMGDAETVVLILQTGKNIIAYVTTGAVERAIRIIFVFAADRAIVPGVIIDADIPINPTLRVCLAFNALDRLAVV